MDLLQHNLDSSDSSNYSNDEDLQKYSIPNVDPNDEKLKAEITKEFRTVGRIVKEHYVVKKIKDFKIDEDGKPVYLIRWYHWPSGFNSWVKEIKIKHNLKFIHNFFQKHPNKLLLRRQVKPNIDKKLAQFKKKSNKKRRKKSRLGVDRPSALAKYKVKKPQSDTDNDANSSSHSQCSSNPLPSTSSRGHHVNTARSKYPKTFGKKPKYSTYGRKLKHFSKYSSSEEEVHSETNPLPSTSSDGHQVNSRLTNPHTFGSKSRYFTTNSSASSSSLSEDEEDLQARIARLYLS